MPNKIHLYNKHAIGPAHKISTQINHPIARMNSSKIRDLQVAATYPLLYSPLLSLI
jgi:hypothetical protein